MNKLRSKRITLTLCETLIYKPQNPKPSCAEIRSSLPRRPRQTLPCARTSPPAHEATSAVHPVRQDKPYCSRGDLDRPSRAPEQALLLTRRPRQTLQCAEQALLLTRRPRQALQCAELAFLLTRRPRQALPCAELALLLTRRPRQALPCARKSLLLTRPMNMTAGAPEGRFHARKTILREGNQLVAELDFPVAEFVEALVTSTGSVPYMT